MASFKLEVIEQPFDRYVYLRLGDIHLTGKCHSFRELEQQIERRKKELDKIKREAKGRFAKAGE